MDTPDSITTSLEAEINASKVCQNMLENTLREGAQHLLKMAIEEEIANYLQQHAQERDENGRRQVVRNGYMPERSLQTGLGEVTVKQPRVLDRREGKSFNSSILPKYMRRVPSLDATIAALYLKGVSTSDMGEALESILGEGARGLSSSNITRMVEQWQQERDAWNRRDLSGKHYVYLWADGIYFNVRLSDDRPCVLVLMGAMPDGTKEMIAIVDGQRESKLSWREMLLDLKQRGLGVGPKLAVADGAMGFWAAFEEVWPDAKQQRCWVHKTANVLDKMPKKAQPKAKEMLHEIYMAESKEDALKAWDKFMQVYGDKYDKACECLNKDKEQLLTFYDFPAAHWKHIRTSNPIESTFATIRHRQRLTKGNGSRKATLAMVFKLSMEAEKHWRRLTGSELLDKVIAGVTFKDGIEEKEAAA